MTPRSTVGFVLASLTALAACSSSSEAPLGPDAGAGCDRTIYAHCTFAKELVPGLGPTCVEYSGARLDVSACAFWSDRVVTDVGGKYAQGPCPRGDYDKACVEPATGGQAIDAGTGGGGACAAMMTVWGHSSSWTVSGIAGLPPCGAL